jgi:hypothetical protein
MRHRESLVRISCQHLLRVQKALARLRHDRCEKSEAGIARILRGDWREEHLFTLRQSLEALRFNQNLVVDCDQQITSRMDALEDRGAGPAPMTRKKGNRPREEPIREKFGVDLTAVEGVSILGPGSPAGGLTPPAPARSTIVSRTHFAWRRSHATVRRRGWEIGSAG